MHTTFHHFLHEQAYIENASIEKLTVEDELDAMHSSFIHLAQALRVDIHQLEVKEGTFVLDVVCYGADALDGVGFISNTLRRWVANHPKLNREIYVIALINGVGFDGRDAPHVIINYNWWHKQDTDTPLSDADWVEQFDRCLSQLEDYKKTRNAP